MGVKKKDVIIHCHLSTASLPCSSALTELTNRLRHDGGHRLCGPLVWVGAFGPLDKIKIGVFKIVTRGETNKLILINVWQFFQTQAGTERMIQTKPQTRPNSGQVPPDCPRTLQYR